MKGNLGLLQKHPGSGLSGQAPAVRVSRLPAGRTRPCRCIASCPLPADVLAVLLTDVLLLLQEKDQKYVFASVVCVLSPRQELL